MSWGALHSRYANACGRILEMLASGMTYEEILTDFDFLEVDDIRAAISFAARVMNHPIVHTAAE